MEASITVSPHRGLQSAVTWLLWTNHLRSPQRTLSCSTCKLNAGCVLQWRDPSSCPEGNDWMLLHVLCLFLSVWYIYPHTHLTFMKKILIYHASAICGDRPGREERELFLNWKDATSALLPRVWGTFLMPSDVHYPHQGQTKLLDKKFTWKVQNRFW